MRNLNIMKPSDEEIKLMDKILQFLSNKNEKRVAHRSVFAAEFNVSSDEAQNAFNKVCKIGHEEEILVAQKSGYGNYHIVSKNNLEINHFISQGGFEHYFQSNYSNENTKESNLTLINSGIIQNVSQGNGVNNIITSKIENNVSAERQKSKTKTILEILSWIGGIIVAGITIYWAFIKE